MSTLRIRVEEVEVGDKIHTFSGQHKVIRIEPVRLERLPGRRISYRKGRGVAETRLVDHQSVTVDRVA